MKKEEFNKHVLEEFERLKKLQDNIAIIHERIILLGLLRVDED